ncbi:MAG: hypothetical protein ACKV19_19780, partial [Verrucomicrobiales bacterium]
MKRTPALVSLASILLAAAPAAFGASIELIDTDDTTQEHWRSTDVAKPLDISGDNAYGTDGYVKTTEIVNPSYATVEFLPGGTDDGTQAPYMEIDNTSDPVGPAISNENSQTRYWWKSPTGTMYEMVSITLTETKTFRIALLHDFRTDSGQYNAQAWQIVGPGDADTGEVTLTNSISDDILGRWTVWELSGVSGDVFTIRGKAGSRSGEADFTRLGFDSIATARPVQVTDIVRNPGNGHVTLTFLSAVGSFYNIEAT